HDRQGKYFLAGGYGPVINIGGNPKTWPQMYLVAALRPKSKEFRFAINLRKPNQDTMVQLEGHYSLEQPPDDVDMLVVGVQVPPSVAFPGFGIYRIEIVEKYPNPATVFSRQISVREGPGPIRPSPQLKLEFHVNG